MTKKSKSIQKLIYRTKRKIDQVCIETESLRNKNKIQKQKNEIMEVRLKEINTYHEKIDHKNQMVHLLSQYERLIAENRKLLVELEESKQDLKLSKEASAKAEKEYSILCDRFSSFFCRKSY